MILVSDDSKGPGGGRYSPLWEHSVGRQEKSALGCCLLSRSALAPGVPPTSSCTATDFLDSRVSVFTRPA